MPAHIEETAQDAIFAPNDDDRLSGNFRRDELAWTCDLLRPSGHLPRIPKNGVLLQVRDAGIDVPFRGNGRRLAQWERAVVGVDNVLQGTASHGVDKLAQGGRVVILAYDFQVRLR